MRFRVEWFGIGAATGCNEIGRFGGLDASVAGLSAEFREVVAAFRRDNLRSTTPGVAEALLKTRASARKRNREMGFDADPIIKCAGSTTETVPSPNSHHLK